MTGGYTGPISTSFASPIAGRNAWNGTNPGSPAYITSTVTLPAGGQRAERAVEVAHGDGQQRGRDGCMGR